MWVPQVHTHGILEFEILKLRAHHLAYPRKHLWLNSLQLEGSMSHCLDLQISAYSAIHGLRHTQFCKLQAGFLLLLKFWIFDSPTQLANVCVGKENHRGLGRGCPFQILNILLEQSSIKRWTLASQISLECGIGGLLNPNFLSAHSKLFLPF